MIPYFKNSISCQCPSNTIFLSLIMLFMFRSLAYSQEVTNVKAEQAGDFIKIRYEILNSTPDQVYRVKVLFTTDGKLNTELRSVTGDVGELVIGGKAEYWVVWDVLRDMDDLGSAEFIVRAELVREKPAMVDGPAKRNFHVMASGQTWGLGYGARIGYMGKLGVSAQYIRARTDFTEGAEFDEISILSRFSMDLTNRLVNSNNFQMHLLTGITFGEAIMHDPGSSYQQDEKKLEPGMELGLAFCLKRTAIAISFARLFPELVEESDPITKISHLSLSYGIRF